MAITKEVTTDRVQILHNTDMEGNPVVLVSVREQVSIIEDGVEISNSFHRYMIGKLDDYSSRPAQVRSVCDIAFA